jgi:transcriptional regulator with XRE-family HTH domain
MNLQDLFNMIKAFVLNFINNRQEFNIEGFGEYLSDLRKSSGLSLREVEKKGRKLGHDFSYNYVHKLEHAKYPHPDKDVVISILKTLELSEKEIKRVLKKFHI